MSRALAAVMSLLLALQQPIAIAATVAATPAGSDALPSLRKVNSLAEDLRGDINRSTFDLDALLDSLDYDADTIIDFVKQEISFEAYKGLLRGPEGTLMSRAGNALDQSVLLAKLLRDAGYDARISRGHLNEQNARALLREMARQVPTEPPVGNVSAALSTLQQFGLLGSISESDSTKVINAIVRPPKIRLMPEYAEFEKTNAFLAAQFAKSSEFSNASAAADLLTEAKEYFWVEYKDGAASPWVAVHPAFRFDPPFDSIETEGTLTESVPADLQHRVRIRMFIERLTKGKLEAIPVTEEWERPVANLVTHPVTFGSLPDTALKPENITLEPEEILASPTFFVPMLDNAPAPGAMYFDLMGNSIDSMAASAPAAGVVKQVGKGFAQATGALGGESSIPMLTANWIEITLIAPGGAEQSYRRMLFDLIGPAARQSEAVPEHPANPTVDQLRPFLRLHTLMVSVGRTARGKAMDSVLEQMRNIQPALGVLMKLASRAPGDAKSNFPPAGNVPAFWPGYLALMTRFDLVESWSEEHRIYRSEPLIAIHTEGVGNGPNRAIEQIDIVHNVRRGVAIDTGYPVPDPRAVMAAGVWETLVEGSMLNATEDHINTMQVFKSAAEQGIGITTIRPGETASEVSLSADAHQALVDDLKRGYAVIVPERKPSNLGHTGWWRVNPRTGVTLGQLDDGRGNDAAEYVIVIIVGVAGYLLLHYHLYKCFSGYDPKEEHGANSLLCCVLSTYGFYFTGGAIGLGIASMVEKFGEAIAIIFELGANAAEWHFEPAEKICEMIVD
ncbi:MAG: hypothetical protein WB812_14795 [Woeseiaceae bacterium]